MWWMQEKLSINSVNLGWWIIVVYPGCCSAKDSVGMLHILFKYTFASFLHSVFWSFLSQQHQQDLILPQTLPSPVDGWWKKILHQFFQIPLFAVLLYISQVLSRFFFHQRSIKTKASQEHAERLVTFASSTPKLKERFGQRMKEFLCFAS